MEDAYYPEEAPFHPHVRFPEYDYQQVSSSPNPVYQAVRSLFQIAGLDAARIDTPSWNPLGELIRPGERVLLKPNLIKESHPRDRAGWKYVMTHGSVVRAVADYVFKAVGPRGKVILADAPHTDSSFEAIVRVLGLDSMSDYYKSHGLDFELLDLRREYWENRGWGIIKRRILRGDPRGTVLFDLGINSRFINHPGSGKYYGSDYDEGEVNSHHTGGRHEYLLSASAIGADVVINIPKLKTHKKAGITVALKNLVGVTADKNWLPHHTEGSLQEGGDEHPRWDLKHRSERLLAALLRRLNFRFPRIVGPLHAAARQWGRLIFGDTEEVIRSGNWWGNDTVWRMCLDLNTILLYGKLDGSLRAPVPENRKRHFVVVDGILAGQGRGPMNPDPVPAGIVVFSLNAACADGACAYLMGFDPEKIPIVREAFRPGPYSLVDCRWQDVRVISNVLNWNARLSDIPGSSTFRFEPHFGWKGHIEREVCCEIWQG